MKYARPINDSTPNVTQAFSNIHKGTDYGYPNGTPVFASESGRVILARRDETRQWIANTATDPYRPSNGTRSLRTEDYGNYIKIDHGNGESTLYAHLKHLSLVVGIGDTVEKGQKIAEVGSTGNSTGNHLHWEVRKNDVVVNPISLMDMEFKGYFTNKDPQTIIDELRSERDKNWGLYQEEIKKSDVLRAERDKNWNLYQEEKKKVKVDEEKEKQLKEFKQLNDQMTIKLNQAKELAKQICDL